MKAILALVGVFYSVAAFAVQPSFSKPTTYLEYASFIEENHVVGSPKAVTLPTWRKTVIPALYIDPVLFSNAVDDQARSELLCLSVMMWREGGSKAINQISTAYGTLNRAHDSKKSVCETIFAVENGVPKRYYPWTHWPNFLPAETNINVFKEIQRRALAVFDRTFPDPTQGGNCFASKNDSVSWKELPGPWVGDHKFVKCMGVINKEEKPTPYVMIDGMKILKRFVPGPYNYDAVFTAIRSKKENPSLIGLENHVDFGSLCQTPQPKPDPLLEGSRHSVVAWNFE